MNLLLSGWVVAKELAFSKVEKDAQGLLQLSRSVVVGQDKGWHVQVCSHVYYLNGCGNHCLPLLITQVEGRRLPSSAFEQVPQLLTTVGDV